MRRVFLLGLVTALALIGAERTARACGGCFGPPDVPTVVTDHRMIMSISKDQSTLYDQIRYTGEPSSFAWVLPIAGTVKIGLSSDALFASLDRSTQLTILGPPVVCRDEDGGTCGRRDRTVVGDDSQDDAPGVTVIVNEVVGPYETVQLATTDPQALEAWLASNGFTLPEDVKPVIAQYVTEKFNFLAMKLVPGKGVNDMRPVRVTTTGAGTLLPLRMVAAGTGPTVGITLWTVAEGRYEPQGFPSFLITNEELTWDPIAQKSNYGDLRAAKTQAGGGRAWEIEASIAITPTDWTSATGWAGYDAERDDSGAVVKTADEVAKEDLETLFHGISSTSARLTRIRADLAHAALDRDLVLFASADQVPIEPFRQAQTFTAQPTGCPAGCFVENAPRPAAPPAPELEPVPSASGSSCATSPTHPTGCVALALGAIAFGAARRRRR